MQCVTVIGVTGHGIFLEFDLRECLKVSLHIKCAIVSYTGLFYILDDLSITVLS